ncbi:hypothetical protein AX769_13420 [Frondihabitans sp. PAMC 28766]|uniref:hypothetical protein n=1 Tax=Frondihabitans sp. PAMC 28766 TaxID=1795630 RepID=UPI00078B91B2|nr:hypothetical protein [Frondihabitans sp. PAMC 28766]AMM20951.1 hypothetical protein AX769_13420 [Frondihabitans sp. PAMC 28766]
MPARSTVGRPGLLLAQSPRLRVLEWLPAALSAVDAAQDPTCVALHPGDGGRQRALAVAAALASLDHPHVVSLRGVVETGEGLGILLPQLSVGTAESWLATRGRVSAGEAVTLLVPLLRALRHMAHRRLDGVTEIDLTARLGLDQVLFDVRGAPVLVGLRAAPARGPERLVRPPGGARGAAARLVRPVLDATGGGDAATIEALRELCTRAAGGDLPGVDEWIEAVFELAPPSPLSGLPRRPAAVPAGPPSEVQLGASLDSGGASSSASPGLSSLGSSRLVSALLGPGGLLARLRRSAREVRPRAWVTAGALMASAIGAVVLLSGPTGSTGASTPAAAIPSASPDPPTVAGQSRPTSTPSPASTRSPSGDGAVLSGDDTDRAVKLLVTLRAACLKALDADCLAGVDQPDSPLLAQDAEAVASPDHFDDLPRELSVGAVVNRLGDSSLYAATGPDDRPASVLVTRTEAGWRLRSIAPSGDQ